jgi:hypothetical protein
MTLFLHLLIKDLRATRLWLGASLVMAASIALSRWLGQWWDSTGPQSGILLLGYLAFLQVALLRQDAPHDANRFLGTRPVAGGIVLLSKATLLIGCGILPVSLAFILHLAVSGIPLTAADLWWIAWENSALLMAVLSLMSFAIVLQNFSAWIAVPVALVALTLLPWGNITLSAGPLLPPVMRLVFALQCALAAAAAAGVTACYIRLKRAPALALCGLAGAVTALLVFSSLQPPEPAVATLPIQVLPRTGGLSAFSQHSTLEIRYDCHLDGLPEGVFAEQTGWTSDLKIQGLPDPRPLWLAMPAPAPWVVPAEIALRALPGEAKTPAPAANRDMYLRLAMVKTTGVKKGDRIRLTLRGVQHFDLLRAELAETVPFDDRGVWSNHGVWLQFDKVARTPDLLKMEVESATIHLGRTGRSGGVIYGMGDFGFYAADLPSRRLFRLEAVTTQTSDTSFYRQSRSNTLLRIPLSPIGPQETGRARESQPPLDPARVTFTVFRRTKIGEAHVPFEFIDVDLQVE